jgi:hypothetical protein
MPGENLIYKNSLQFIITYINQIVSEHLTNNDLVNYRKSGFKNEYFTFLTEHI